MVEIIKFHHVRVTTLSINEWCISLTWEYEQGIGEHSKSNMLMHNLPCATSSLLLTKSQEIHLG